MSKDVDRYHPRRMELDLSPEGQLAVIRGQRFLTMALCQGQQPYLASMNYAYREEERCFYVHSSVEGKKLDILRANPAVWGQIVEDRGYDARKCTHSYRSVQFQAVAEFVDDPAEMVRALGWMIEHGNPDPEPLKRKMQSSPPGPGDVRVLRLRVLGMSGKCNPAEAGGANKAKV